MSLTPSWSQKIVGQNETLLFILEIYSPVIDVFTHKLIVPLKASRDQKKFRFRHWCDAHRAWSRTPNTESCLKFKYLFVLKCLECVVFCVCVCVLQSNTFDTMLQQQYLPDRCRRAMYRSDWGLVWDPFYKVEGVGCYVMKWASLV